MIWVGERDDGADTTRQTRAQITKEDQVHVTKGVCRGASSGAWRWFLVLVDRAEYSFQALPGVVVEHRRRRAHYFASSRISADGVLRPLSAHGDLVQQENFHRNEGLHLLVIDLRQVQLCLQFDVEFEEAMQRGSGHVGAWGARFGSVGLAWCLRGAAPSACRALRLVLPRSRPRFQWAPPPLCSSHGLCTRGRPW